MNTRRKFIKEDHDSNYFLHGYEENEDFDAEGEMAKSQLHRVKEIVDILDQVIEDNDQLPAWVQSHIAIAYENLNQVMSYIEPKIHLQDDEVIDVSELDELDESDELDEAGLWDNIWAKRRRGEPPAKPGDKNYPKTLDVGKKKKKKK